MGDRTIRTVPNYGASLRQQLDAMGWTQGRLASESATSRQTISRAINHDEVSNRTRARLDGALGRAPGRRRSNRRQGVGSATPASGGALCDGTDLVAWADRRAAQSLLPLAIRRLVQATGLNVGKLTMASGEGVQLSGWDGIVHADRSSAFVPRGASGWEMSVGRNPSKKAEENWERRTNAPGPLVAGEATFVFVTLRRWSGKEEWATQKIDDGPWRDVRVLDADDLAAWLEEAPAVHTWLSIEIGKIPPDGTGDLRSHWKHWAGATYPRLTRRFLLLRRNDRVGELHQRLSGMSGAVLVIQAESRSEAIAWVYCAIRKVGSEKAEAVLARCLVVASPEGLRHLISAKSPLVLVLTFNAEELAAAAARAGHLVVVPLDEAVPGHDDDVVQLGPLCRRSVAEALREAGIGRHRAYQMAGLASRSLTALRRSIAVAPVLGQPEWSRPAIGRGLLPALLLGSWMDSNPKDGEVISSLARRPYEEVTASLLQWSVGSDPLVRRRDDAWYLVSALDAWRLLRRYIMREDLGRFETAATTVLGSVHPAFELPTEQRWMAGALGYSAEHSGFLGDGLARTLAIMGVHGSEVPSATFSARQTSKRIVRKLLEEANRDWRLWASLSTRLRLLAEAAPDHFLDAVEAGLDGSEPVLAGLFASNGDPTFASREHTGLLRALEVLAWSGDHLGRVATLLARLDEIDLHSELRQIEGSQIRSIHRPLTVLKEIFRSWMPQTSASLAERLAVLDRLRVSHSEVAWYVMRSMLPAAHSVGHPTARPLFREWGPDDRRGLAEPDEQTRTVSEVVLRMLEDAASNGRKWASLLERLKTLPRREHDLVIAALKALDPDEIGEETRSAIWEAIRSLVSHHRAFPTANWAMPEEHVTRLANILNRFTPRDPVALYGWLFRPQARLVDGGDVEETPWEGEMQRLTDTRVKAVSTVLERGGLNGLRALAGCVRDPYQLGLAVADTPVASAIADELLSRHLADAEAALHRLAFGYVVGSSRRFGGDWVIRQVNRAELGLNLDQQVNLLLALPARPKTWRLAAECGTDISLAYWRRIPQERFFGKDHLVMAVTSLVEAGRPFVAVDLLALKGYSDADLVAPEMAAMVLEAAISSTGEHDAPSASFANAAGVLLDVLGKANHDRTRLARLEWQLAPAMRWRHTKPDTLHHLLSENPGFFAEMLSLVYMAESESVEDVSPEEERRAESGALVLDSWRTIPGSRDRGDVDGDRLRKWIDHALSAKAMAGRVKIGHHVIGRMLSAGPQDADGTWPCAAVRDVIEELASADLEEGFSTGVFNSRGMVTKDPSAGGAAERVLAQRYNGFAMAIRAAYPRTARMLRTIAEWYRRDASREDFKSVLVEEL